MFNQEIKFSRLAVLLSGLLFFTGCQFGEDEPEEVPELAEETSVIVFGGSVGDGPVVNARISLSGADGTELAATDSDEFANYGFSVAITQSDYPLQLTATGGIDLVTLRAPDFPMVSALWNTGSGQVANINPYSTLGVKLAELRSGGVTAANMAFANSAIYAAVPFGLVPELVADPLSTQITTQNIATVVKGSEALAESVRRTSSNLSGAGFSVSPEQVLDILAADLVDGTLDGIGASGADARLAAMFNVVMAEVNFEAMRNSLLVDGSDAMQPMDDAIAVILGNPPISPSTRFVPISSGTVAQTMRGTNAARAAYPDGVMDETMWFLEGLPTGAPWGQISGSVGAVPQPDFSSAVAAVTTASAQQLSAINTAAQSAAVPPAPQSEPPPPAPAQCSDGVDNDGDGAVDFPADPGCADASDNDETDAPTPPPTPAQCSDGVDNDGDGAVDFPADPGCSDANDDDETDPSSPPPGDPTPSGNLALNKPAQASSEDGATYAASKAVDGSASTRWSSDYSDPQWLQVDLQANYTIDRVILSWQGAYGSAYQIQVSSDAQNWSPVFSETAGDGATDDISFNPTVARYVRMYGTQRGTVYTYSLWEFEVYGGSQSQPPPPPAPAQCSDGVDNDGDGAVDFPADPGCADANDDDETDPPAPPPPAPAQCSDGVDNDGDGLVDFPADAGCSDANDNDETDPPPPPPAAQCSDGIDNDGDGLVDFPADAGCSDANDDDETDPPPPPPAAQCSDGIDNDGDGLVDFPADAGCSDANDNDETDPAPPADTVAPTVSFVSPPAGSTGVSLLANVSVTFSEAVDPATVSTASLSVVGSGGQVAGSLETIGNVVTFRPASPFQGGSSVNVQISTGIADLAGNNLASTYTFNFTTATSLDVPNLAQWEADMIQFGNQIGQAFDPNGQNKDYNETYYDSAWVFYQIADYTGQAEPWNTYARWANQKYYNYLAPSFAKPGYWLFSHGLRENFERGGIITQADLVSMRDKPAYSDPGWDWNGDGYDDGNYEAVSREVAYNLQNHINAERAGLPRATRGGKPTPQYYVEYMEKHLHEWITQTYRKPSGGRFAPFMFALTSHALIEFYEWELQNGRDPNAYWPGNHWPDITTALAAVADWAYHSSTVASGANAGKRMWEPDYDGNGHGAFRYEDINNAKVSPDLNQLIAPVYGWLYRETGNAGFRVIGDELFAGGVAGAYLASGKQFNQNYRLSFSFLRWRSEGDAIWGSP